MSTGERQIQCRKCKEDVPAESDTCPHCGTPLRSRLRAFVAIAFGLLVGVASVTDLGELWFYGLIGLAVAGVGVALLYDRRQRMRTGPA